MKIFKYKLDKHIAEALGATLDAAMYWQMEFAVDFEYECEYIEAIEMMRYIYKIRENVFKIITGEDDTLMIIDEESIVCIKKVLDFINDWDNNIVDAIDLGETLIGKLYCIDESQRDGVKVLYAAILKHIENNYINKDSFDFDIETTFKSYYNVM